MKNYLKAVIVGEVDAGKSSLIGRFLFDMGSVSKEAVEEINSISGGFNRELEFAYLLDSFEEERKDKLTIDTTQVFCKGKKGRGFIFIDVPGHKELLRNALCGSTYADTAVLVIDIQKSIEEGTKNHIRILKFLGIEKVIVALNKMDLIGFDKNTFKNIKSEVLDFCKSAGIACECIIPVSAAKGDNLVKDSKTMTWYKGPTLIRALNNPKNPAKKERTRDFYFAIQDNYTIGAEEFLVGPILSGSIRKGQAVKISPEGKESRVEKIQILNRIRSFASEKESPGLVISESQGINRGQILYAKTPPQVTTEITAKIFCVRHLDISGAFILRCLTQETPAKISQILKVIDAPPIPGPDTKIRALNEASVAEVVIKTEKPVAIKKYSQLGSLGRFILEDERQICAAGIIA